MKWWFTSATVLSETKKNALKTKQTESGIQHINSALLIFTFMPALSAPRQFFAYKFN